MSFRQIQAWTIYKRAPGARRNRKPRMIVANHLNFNNVEEDNLADVDERGDIRSSFTLCFFHQSSEDKSSIYCATPPETKLFLSKKIVIFCSSRHQATHPHGHKAKQVRGYGDRAVLGRFERISTL